MNNKNFDDWNQVKQNIQVNTNPINFKDGEIFFTSIGYNIGYESYGKGKDFLRPVVVIKKYNKYSFLGIPLSSKLKEGYYYHTVNYNNIKNIALLSQAKVFDSRRLKYKHGKLSIKEFKILKNTWMERINPSKEGSEHSSNKKLPKSDLSIPYNKNNVKADANVPNILQQDGVMNSIFDMANQGITHVPDLIKKYGKENSWSHTLVDTESNSATLICQLPGEGNRKHHHPDWNEWWFIIDGTWQWNIENEIKIIKKGDLIFMPKGVKHKITAIGTEAAIRIAVSRYDVAHVYEKEDY